MHLSMNPLKQGLKPEGLIAVTSKPVAFIHESIKTRVETTSHASVPATGTRSLSMNPLKQGLKLNMFYSLILSTISLYP